MNKYTIKDNIDKIIYKVYNFLADFIFLFKSKEKKLIKQNIKFKDIHKGERCFILGTGPSLGKLTSEQVEGLKKEITIGVNSLYKATFTKDLVPSYYALFDNLYWGEFSNAFTDIKEKYSSRCPVFFTDYRAENIIKQMGVVDSTIFLYGKKYPVNEIHNNICKNMDIAQNVVGTCILIAIYLGFKEIYLLGCDYNSFAHLQDVHCYNDSDEIIERENRLGFLLKFYAITTEIHYLIAKLAKQRGVKIINATPNSLLDAYQRKDLSTLF